jgi:hypothetical protein
MRALANGFRGPAVNKDCGDRKQGGVGTVPAYKWAR